MRERETRIVLDEADRHHQVPRHGLGVALVQAQQIATDGCVEIGRLHVLGQIRFLGTRRASIHGPAAAGASALTAASTILLSAVVVARFAPALETAAFAALAAIETAILGIPATAFAPRVIGTVTTPLETTALTGITATLVSATLTLAAPGEAAPFAGIPAAIETTTFATRLEASVIGVTPRLETTALTGITAPLVPTALTRAAAVEPAAILGTTALVSTALGTATIEATAFATAAAESTTLARATAAETAAILGTATLVSTTLGTAALTGIATVEPATVAGPTTVETAAFTGSATTVETATLP